MTGATPIFTVPKNSTVTLKVRADLKPKTDLKFKLGQTIRFVLDSSFIIKGSASGSLLPGAPQITFRAGDNDFPYKTVLVPMIVNILAVEPAPGTTVNRTYDKNGFFIGKFVLQNPNQAGAWMKGYKFTDLGQNTNSNSNHSLYVSASGSNDPSSLIRTVGGLNFGDALGAFIDSNSFVTIGVKTTPNPSPFTFGDTRKLSIQNLGDITFFTYENQLNYDANHDGMIGFNSVGPFPVAGKSTAGAYTYTVPEGF
jgi:hypothetical protein